MSLFSRRGFTMVEIIVVLIILAVLAAILIPSLSGYVDRANEKALISEARSALLAAQTLSSEIYALGLAPSFDETDEESGNEFIGQNEIAALSETPAECVTALLVDKARVTLLTYEKGTHTATYTATDGWEITDAP